MTIYLAIREHWAEASFNEDALQSDAYTILGAFSTAENAENCIKEYLSPWAAKTTDNPWFWDDRATWYYIEEYTVDHKRESD